jgi:predicted nucleotidyltransferase
MPREPGWNPRVASRIKLDEAHIAQFCWRWLVARLELFGSVLRDDFRPDSDVDVLVTFQPDANWGLLDHTAMTDQLSQLFGRRVDLLTRRAVERSTNRLRRQAILASAVPLYSSSPVLSA